ncbi:S1 RNA-binding domain-containing protein [Streptomyces sp. NPDC006208]|uniref:S1 RNA-binding domain-containing protein n=1 Tax=Streptomyces sp. NPDC006208 TaxID=3156734 RepID=UPI0033BD2F79
MASFVYRITPYDPAEREAADHDRTAVQYDSRERVAAACVAAAAGFALDAGADHLTVDNPMLEGFFSFSVRRRGGGHGLSGLFPYGLAGYHDGAGIPLATGLGLLRAMVLRDGTWCRLVTASGFFLHVGDQDDVYVGSDRPHDEAVARTRALGLFAEPVQFSPYDPAFDETDGERPAGDVFWAELCGLVAEHGGVLLEERHIANAYRWHRVTTASEAAAVRRRLAPRARLSVWPDLSENIEAVRAAILRRQRLELLVEQGSDGGSLQVRIAETWMARADGPSLLVAAGAARRAALVPLEPADRHPLLAGVLPDADGVLRARWRTNRTRADERRTLLGSLRVGDVVTGVVATGLDDVGVHVDLNDDLGRGLGFLRVPEMSWDHIGSVDDIAPVGREIRARIIGIDWAWERVNLSLKALRPDPLGLFAAARQVGETIPGRVTKLVPFGAFVRLAEGVEGLVHLAELADRQVEGPEDVVAVGDDVLATLIGVDLERRRISLSLRTRTE